ncbi:MAG: helix-turn-helix domain-containing protein [Actinomycetota bacterium]
MPLARSGTALANGKRAEPGLSEEGLADRAGVHRTYIGHVERGESNLTEYSLVAIADALQIDPAELIRALRP